MKKSAANRTIYLSRSERRVGGRLFLRFSAFNGLGISFLGDATVALLAIHFGAGNTELGLISAMMHISGIALLVVPRIFRGKSVARVGFGAWLTRGLVSIPYVALLMLEGRAAVALILTLYALFCLARTVGVAMVTTVQKRLMVRRTQNDVIFRSSSSFQGTSIISRLISFLVLSIRALSELTGLLILPVLGIIANTAAAFTFRRIPNRTRVDYRPGQNLLVILRRAMGQTRSRRILFMRWISLAQTILFAMAVPFLRRSVGLSSARIFLFTMTIGLAAFLSSIALRPIAIRAGSRPLLFFAALPGFLLFGIWIVIPATYSLEIYAIIGFVTMFALNASNLAANRLLVDITPDDGAVGFNAMETFVTSVLALAIGFGAGSLADLSEVLSRSTPVNPYGLVFLPAALGALLQAVLVLRTDEPGSMGLMEAAKIITNIENLRTWQTVANLEATADPVKRKTLVHNVGHSRAPVASSEIGRILAEPLSAEKGELIDALFVTSRPELVPALCDEAADPESFHRKKAIFALGNYPGERTRAVLETLLNDPAPGVRAAAAKSLGRIGERGHRELAYRLWEESENLHQRLDLMIALFHMDEDRRYVADLFSRRIIGSGERAERTLYTLLSRQFGMSPPLGVLYREERMQPGAGLEVLLEESRDTRFLLERENEIEEAWYNRDYRRVWEICRSALDGVEAPQEVQPIQRALTGFPLDAADAANALAALYFTYQVLTAEAAA